LVTVNFKIKKEQVIFMSKLQAGFARLDITPPLETILSGYFFHRYAEGVMDPLYASTVVFDNGESRAVVMNLDLIGINQVYMDRLRAKIAQVGETSPEGVFIACTHTHFAPCISNGTVSTEYIDWLEKRLCDTVTMAVRDLAPTQMSYTRGRVEDVAFVRRYRLKDGSCTTNPGFQNPNVVGSIGTPDEQAQLLILKRENAPEIGIVNFQVHPDVVTGYQISSDYPRYVRETYEQLIPNSRCLYINGAQGDTNHIDIRLGPDKIRRGPERAAYMGRKIAMAVVANYPLADPLSGDEIRFAQKNLTVKSNKVTISDEEVELARKTMVVHNAYLASVRGTWESYKEHKTHCLMEPHRAVAITRMLDAPEENELYLTAVAVGPVVFAGFPGEPFTDVGRSVKAQSKFTLTIPSCCANGYEGYFPTEDAYAVSGYEATSARFVAGTAERLIETSAQLINSL